MANAKKISRRMMDRTRTPTQEAADWIEYSMRNENGKYLRVHALDMPWYQSINLDVYATLIVFVALLFFLLYKLLARFLGKYVALALIFGGLSYVAQA